MNSFTIHILASEHSFYEGPCESLVVPTIRGQYGIQAGHSNLISAVAPGKLTFRIPGGENQVLAVSEGIVKVEHGEVLVLVDTAERPEDIDVNRAKRAAEEAKEELLQKRSAQEYHAAQAQLARALNRLKVKNTRI